MTNYLLSILFKVVVKEPHPNELTGRLNSGNGLLKGINLTS